MHEATGQETAECGCCPAFADRRVTRAGMDNIRAIKYELGESVTTPASSAGAQYTLIHSMLQFVRSLFIGYNATRTGALAYRLDSLKLYTQLV